MLAMQYVIGLPADYDMGIIRHRVATRGAAMDAFPGLGLKAYGIRERGIDDAPANEYAPFYLWRTLTGMNAFLWGDGFAGICRDFGRPEVRQWAGAGVVAGPARDTPDCPRLATVDASPFSPGRRPARHRRSRALRARRPRVSPRRAHERRRRRRAPLGARPLHALERRRARRRRRALHDPAPLQARIRHAGPPNLESAWHR